MDQYITGTAIRQLREQKKMTQSELATELGVSDKTVSKWETGKGYPDITLLEPIARAFGVSIAELLSGNTVQNANVSANMMRSKFYVCPVCGNVIHSMGEAVICCHGIQLMPEEPEEADAGHELSIERIEDEYYIRIGHEMSKSHHISFIATASAETCELVKLYPEGPAEARFKIRGVKKLFYYCNRDGLYQYDILQEKKNR